MNSRVKLAGKLISSCLNTHIFSAMGKQFPLRHLNFEIIDACNSRCKFCNIWQTKQSPDMLTAEEIIRIFQDPFFKSLEGMIITGGEPFLRKDLNEILFGINSSILGVFFALSTNGLLPERVIDTANFCLSNNINFAVGISLDDADERHDEIRGIPGNFKKVDFMIDELVKIREQSKTHFEILLAHCLCDEGVESLPRIRKFAKKKGINYFTQIVEEFSFYNHLDKVNHKTDLSPEEIKKIMKETPSGLRNYRRNGERLEVNRKYSSNKPLIDALNSLPVSYHNEYLKRVLNGGSSRFTCFSLRNFYFMKCNGNVAPCLRFSHTPVGNLRHSSAEKIFQGAKAKSAREGIAKCDGCANTWATDWSMEMSFLSFTGLLLKSLMAKRKSDSSCEECTED